VIELRLHTVAYSEVDANGFIGIQFDAFGEEKSGIPTSETHHPHGFRSRNRDPEGEFGSNVLVGWEGDEAHALLGARRSALDQEPAAREKGRLDASTE
jgi:hypothetical protein